MKTQPPINTKKEIAINNHIFYWGCHIPLGVFIFLLGLNIDETFFTVGGIILVVISAMIMLSTPLYYIFTNEKLIICHALKVKEIIFWKDVRDITKEGSWFYQRSFGPILPSYEITYLHQKQTFFKNGVVCKSKKVKLLLQKYYNKEIK